MLKNNVHIDYLKFNLKVMNKWNKCRKKIEICLKIYNLQ